MSRKRNQTPPCSVLPHPSREEAESLSGVNCLNPTPSPSHGCQQSSSKWCANQESSWGQPEGTTSVPGFVTARHRHSSSGSNHFHQHLMCVTGPQSPKENWGSGKAKAWLTVSQVPSANSRTFHFNFMLQSVLHVLHFVLL